MTSTVERRVPIKRVDDSLLKCGVAIMPGGEDQLGRPLVVFPTTTPAMLRQRHTTAHLVLLLRYYVTVTDVVTRHGGMAVIANLTTYSTKDTLQIVVDTLDKMQAEICGSVGVLYAIQPRSKDAQKSLKKLLGLKPSKKHPKVPTYEVILLESIPDLQRYIQRRHLTSDFGGTMTYNHRIWAQLTQDVEDLDEVVTSVLHRVPDAVDKVTMMSEYDLPASSNDSEALLLQVRSKYNDIMRNINLEHLIDECKSLQEKLFAPHKHEGYNDITQTVTFIEAKIKVVDYRNRMIKVRESLKLLWQQAERRIMLASKVNKYKIKAEKVIEWIQGVGLPTVNQDPDIADCLSKAEILRNHFETGFLAIAKNVLWLAEKILKKLESVLQECSPPKPSSNAPSSPRSTHQSQTESVLAYTRQFQATVEYFKRAVEKKHKVYINVHAFYLSAVKLTKWYRRTLKFLPVQLLIPVSRVAGPRPTTAAQYVSSAWWAAIDDFLLHHPLPLTEDLTKMKNIIPVIDNIGIRNQARLLISRVTLIRSLLVSPEHLSLHDLQDILFWRDQVSKGQDEIYLNLITSTLDLSCITDPTNQEYSKQGGSNAWHWQVEAEAESPSAIVNASVRTPKLRLSGGNDKSCSGDQLAEGSVQFSDRNSKEVHLAGTKNGKHKGQQGSLGLLQGENNIHSTGHPHVPPASTQGVNSPIMQMNHTHRSQFVKRQQSFGIYGHVDDPRKATQIRRTGRSVPNLASQISGSNDTTDRQQAEKELYVSLGGAATSPESSQLPVSLKHINIHALKKNLPQANEEEVQAIPPTSFGFSGGHPNGRPHSYESLVDSGIAHTQSSAEGSGVSGSTNGLSPSLSVGQGHLDTLKEGDERDPEHGHEHWAQGHYHSIQGHIPEIHSHDPRFHDRQNHTTNHPIHNPKSQSHNLNDQIHSPLPQTDRFSNLAYEQNGHLSLVQNNIDIIVNSSLSAEEKLKLMATMCECESIHSSQAGTDTTTASLLSKEAVKRSVDVQDNLFEPRLQHQGDAVSSGLSKAYLQNRSLRASQGDLTAQNVGDSHTVRVQTPGLTHDNLLESYSPLSHSEQIGASLMDSLAAQQHHLMQQSQTEPQQLHVTRRNQDHATNMAQIQNGRQPGPTEALLLAQHSEGFGCQGTSESYNGLGDYLHGAGFGIDIEAWMMNQEDGSSEVLLTQLARSDQAEDGMAEYVEKWKHARENRQGDEEELAKARVTLKALRVHEELLKQQAVERSLTHTEQLLQEQEKHIREEQKHMAVAADEMLATSECSLSSGTNAVAVDDAVSFKGDSLPYTAAATYHQQCTHYHSSGSDSPPREVYDSSLSGESGVFTLNSSDFQLIKAAQADMTSSGDSSPQTHTGLSHSAGAGLITQAELLKGRAALSKSFSGTATVSSTIGTSGIVKQIDFRDLIKSINAESKEEKENEVEAEDDDDELSEEVKEAIQIGDPLPYTEPPNISLDKSCIEFNHSSLMNAIQMDDEKGPAICELNRPSDLGIIGNLSLAGSTEDVVQEAKSIAQRSVAPSSDSDVTENTLSSNNSTPMNSPRMGSLSQSLKKWNSIDLSLTEEDNLSALQRDLNENLTGENNMLYTRTMRPTLNAKNTALVGEEVVHRTECATTNTVPQTVHNNISTRANSKPLKSMPEGLEFTEHVDMKVKVAAVGGSAWTNAISIPSYSMEFLNLKTPVIIDNGSGTCKCGFADQDLPSAIFPALVGRAKYEDVSVGRIEECYVGSAAQSMRGVLKLQHPLEHGIITDWNDMELIWQHAFEEQLRINPSEHPVLVTEAALNPKKNREHMMELLFETFQVPGLYFAVQAVLALYASGRTTGMVVDSGDGVTHFVPIYEGYSLPHATQRLDLAGRDLTQYMAQLLYEKGHSFTSTAEKEIARDMKEQHCFVAKDYCADMQRAETSCDMEEFYTLPDGRSISLTTERFRCPEVLFDPTVIGHEHGGIHVSAYKSVMKCDFDLRKQLFSNIVLSGGTTMLPGFGARLQEEVTALTPSGIAESVNVTSPDDRYYSVWQGGAVLASLPTFHDCWVSYEEYLDVGANVIHLKCF